MKKEKYHSHPVALELAPETSKIIKLETKKPIIVKTSIMEFNYSFLDIQGRVFTSGDK